MTRVLVIATYPIKNPQHGGQKRTAAIVKEYKRNFGQVRFVSVFFKGFYKDHGREDIAVGIDTEEKLRRSPLTGDIVCGEAIYADKRIKRRVQRLLVNFKPEIIHIEQPFPYLGLKPLLEETNLTPKIIFGSQNIEAPMKYEILEGAGQEASSINTVVQKINELEVELSNKADLVVACTENDLKVHQSMGAKKLVLAQNGIEKLDTKPSISKRWQNIFKKQGVNKTILFIGSAHPPNWTGFLDMVGKELGFVPFDSRIVLAGSICDYFESSIKPNKSIEDATFWLRAYSAGRLSEQSLRGLISRADIIILPITEGGGSNLKTAEAILANKKVVATSHALRSFEWFREFPNVWVADTKKGFQESMVSALKAESIQRSQAQQRKVKQVLWKQCLASFMEEAKNL